MAVTFATLNRLVRYYALVEARDRLARVEFRQREAVLGLLDEAIQDKRDEWSAEDG